ncbi:Wzy polymerase domain-containing protein [Aquincola sp. MAHUQ-54]|uniref:Wzy polymerase domain-containing protein n=1 Tax=Aquincola agrisoli TaxID=3119538 RepID=A0AAW9QIK0_9BURK
MTSSEYLNLRLSFLAATLAASAPALIGFNQPPSSTFYNQAAAAALWAVFVAVCAPAIAASRRTAAPRAPALRDAAPLLLALALLALAAWLSTAFGSLPPSLATAGVVSLAAAAVMVASGVAAAHSAQRGTLLQAFWIGWLVAGVLSAAIGVVQVFLPGLADGNVIARSGLLGRAVGNLRQPNHLSSLLLWSAIAVVPLLEARRLPRAAAAALMALLVFGITLSGSRTGLVGMAVLTLWGLLDGRLQRPARALLLAVPLMFALSWALMTVWAGQTAQTFGAALHMAAGGDISSSRFGIWRDTLSLITMHPWTGVGFGEFNFAWSLTPFPHRPVAFFDHTHNLPLQFAVELGLPLAALVLGLLAWGLWRAWRRSLEVAGAEGSAVRAAFMMVLMMALHSQLEYPLWYLYFLLPTAWAWGACLGAGRTPPAAAAATHPPLLLRAAGITMLVAALAAVADYRRAVVIYAPPSDAAPLAQRIREGQAAWLFGHQGDYAAATTAEPPSQAMPAFGRATHNLIDTRLMIAWAKAYAGVGDLARARHLADRLREFRNPNADAFFAECDDPARTPRPFQCDPAPGPMDWRDFR